MTAGSSSTTVHGTPEKESKIRTLEAYVASAGIAPSRFMSAFRKELLATPDPERAINGLLRFLASGFASSLIKDFSDHPLLLTVALTLFGHSQYLTDILVRNPELFHWLVSTNALNATKAKDEYKQGAMDAIILFERSDKKMDALKRFQRREFLRISARDIMKKADLESVTNELSWLADAVIAAALRVACDELNRRVGSEVSSTLAVVGLGKLGGEELNFSSDIDLIFVYDRDGDLDFAAERIYSFHQFYCRLAEYAVRRLTETTEEGHLYRVDTRLRPDGSSGPLAMSREGYYRYYEARGELWERQMLLKARIVAGDETVGERWMSDIRPFVYPVTALRDPFDEIRSIKHAIESKLGELPNVKLSRGGIRDIEFVIQALQLLRSGGDKELREKNTLKAIEKLSGSLLLTKQESGQLTEGYVFLREVEHRLQLLHGSQTHELPGNKTELRLLAKRLGFTSTALLERSLKRTQSQVRKIFDSVMQSDSRMKEATKSEPEWSEAKLRQLVTRNRFLDAQNGTRLAKEILKEFRPEGDWGSIKKLFAFLKKSGAPGWGLAHFHRLSSARPLGRMFAQAFSNDEMLDFLVRICSRSKRLSNLLATEPLLFESLVGRSEDFFRPGLEWDFFLKSDPSRFRTFNEAKVIVRFLTKDITIEQSGRELSKIADAVLRSNLREITSRFPDLEKDLLVVALGKYGGEEILIGSDLDLLIIYRQSLGTGAHDDYEKAGREFINSFADEPNSIYHIDLRLRPEGKNAPIATECSYYESYLRSRADIWEKQALLKARVVFGSDTVASEFNQIRQHALSSVAASRGWSGSIKQMREKMEMERTRSKSRRRDLKVGKGGLVDLEFILQSIQLKHFAADPVVDTANSFDAIEKIAKYDFLSQSDIRTIKTNYVFLRQLDFVLKLNSDTLTAELPRERELLQAVAAGMNERSIGNLVKKVRTITTENRALFYKVFSSLEK